RLLLPTHQSTTRPRESTAEPVRDRSASRRGTILRCECTGRRLPAENWNRSCRTSRCRLPEECCQVYPSETSRPVPATDGYCLQATNPLCTTHPPTDVDRGTRSQRSRRPSRP